MQFGENDGAIGYLVGEECRGMEYMFAMMNSARLAVGREGVGIAERAYQQLPTMPANGYKGVTPRIRRRVTCPSSDTPTSGGIL